MSDPSRPPSSDPGFERRRTSFGAVAQTYASVRPDWPAPTVAWLTDADDGRTLDVLDLGAGTGKLTTALLGAGHRVVAVEPSPPMRQQLAVVAPAAQVRAGSAEQLPVDDACVDVVTVAQAWHWFDARRAADECHRVLRPGGLLSIAWHARDERVDWVRDLSVLAGRPHHPAAEPSEAGSGVGPEAGSGVGPEAGLEQFQLGPGFGPVEFREFSYRQRLTPDQLVGLASTWSYVAVSTRREAVLAEVHALAVKVAGPDGEVVVPHRTWCYRARRV